MANFSVSKTSVTSVPVARDPWKFNSMDVIGVLAGSVAGAVFWKNHRVLGFLAGGSAANAGINAIRGNFSAAAISAIPTATGVATSLYWKNHSAWGFILGHLGASAITGTAVVANAGGFEKYLAEKSTIAK